MSILSNLLKLSIGLLVTTSVTAAPANLQDRASVAAGKIVGFPATVPAGIVGDIYKAYQPLLKVKTGCVPAPAVNAEGDTNGGLDTTGGHNSGCGKNTGQVYARSSVTEGKMSVMYAWYFEKDNPSPELGHRHDWEGVIIHLAGGNSTTKENIRAVCPSAHGKWECHTKGYSLDGTRPLTSYSSSWPINHSLDITSSKGGSQPIIAWESLPEVARKALDTTNFGKANVPINENNFQKNLKAATY